METRTLKVRHSCHSLYPLLLGSSEFTVLRCFSTTDTYLVSDGVAEIETIPLGAYRYHVQRIIDDLSFAFRRLTAHVQGDALLFQSELAV